MSCRSESDRTGQSASVTRVTWTDQNDKEHEFNGIRLKTSWLHTATA